MINTTEEIMKRKKEEKKPTFIKYTSRIDNVTITKKNTCEANEANIIENHRRNVTFDLN